MHYYKRNIGDYHKKAGRLSILQHGVYTLLIDACYDREAFPNIDEAIDWAWASSEEEIAAVKFVLTKFFIKENGLYIQRRIQEDLDKYHSNSLTNKRIAVARENKRKSTKRDKNSTKRAKKSTKRVRSVNEPPPNHKPLTINHKPVTNSNSKTSTKVNEVQEIFNHWVLVMKKSSGSLLNNKRTKAIKARLAEGYTVEQIKDAIVGCSMTPHNMGKNDNGKKYDDLELICRNGSNVERFAENIKEQKPKLYSAVTEQNIKNLKGGW